jgi:hypothetical protein
MRNRWAETSDQIRSENERVSVVPTRVRNTNKTIGGPINGKITENVQAKVTASIQHAIANSGLYVLGYVAIGRD